MDYAKYEKLRERIMGRGVVIAIDGPSGAGKSTISRHIAAALDLGYLDTGAMYRGLAWGLEHRGVDIQNPAQLEAALSELKVEINPVPHAPRIFIDGIDVKQVIRTDHISAIVSSISAIPEVRSKLIAEQREIISQAVESTRGIVVEGRDITTVVVPDAPVRILLTANPGVRLERRSLESCGDNEPTSLAEQRELVLNRDMQDSQVNNFTTPAAGVVTIDSTDLDISQTLDRAMQLIDSLVA